jgi:hypothetical protein
MMPLPRGLIVGRPSGAIECHRRSLKQLIEHVTRPW